MADPKIEDHSNEMEQQLDQLGDHIDDAEHKLQARKRAAGVAGEPSGPQDASGGEDAASATNDVRPEDEDEDGRVPEEVASPT